MAQASCDICGAALVADEEGTLTSGDVEIEYSFTKCEKGHYELGTDPDAVALLGNINFDVAARGPFPDGRWVRLSQG